MWHRERKAGLVTLPGSFNYGNRLQLYAVQRAFASLGWASCELVLAERRNPVREIKRFGKRVLRRNKEVAPEALMSAGRRKAFKRFSANIKTECLARLDKTLSTRFEKFSVGSDQVWNPNYITYNDDWYFLKFARPEQRIALAASIGLDTLSVSQARRISRGVSGFASISVREARGAELIRDCSGRTASVLCDPTFTLSSEDWRKIACPWEDCGPYVLTYLLGGSGKEADELIATITAHGEIELIPLSDRQRPEEPDAGPAEFISLIDHAEHVVTDSFHAAVFASILQTPLTIVRREGGTSMFSRLDTLTQMLGIEHKIYGSPVFDLSRAGDYEGVSEAIDRERKKFMSYLEMCLDD